MKTAHEILCEKMDKEMDAFKKSYESMIPTQVYNDWYIIGFKEEFYDMLSNDTILNENIEDEIAWLATVDNPLQSLYEYWEDCSGDFSHDWYFMLDILRDAYESTMED